MVALPAVELSDEERQECEGMLRSLTHVDGGHYVAPNEVADSIKRSIITLCLLGRAERFEALSQSQPEFAERACQAAAKACAV
jgi:hypothetical protein